MDATTLKALERAREEVRQVIAASDYEIPQMGNLQQTCDLLCEIIGSVYAEWGAETERKPRSTEEIQMTAQEVGQYVGEAMAKSVIEDDLSREWTGIEAQDADQFTAAGIEPNTPEWEKAEAAAKEAFETIFERDLDPQKIRRSGRDA